jgi:hypothetical protein
MSKLALPLKRKRAEEDLESRLNLLKTRIFRIARVQAETDPISFREDALDSLGLAEKFLVEEVLHMVAKHRPRDAEGFLSLYAKYFTPDEEEELSPTDVLYVKRFSEEYGPYLWSEIDHHARFEDLLDSAVASQYEFSTQKS